MTALSAIPSTWYLGLGLVLFAIGVFGVLVRQNAIIVLMCIELMLNAVNVIMVAFSAYYADLSGQVFVFFVMLVAAAEAAVGLAILTRVYQHKGAADLDQMSRLKG